MLQGYAPLHRIAKPEEVAEAAVWLCTPKASYVLGHAQVADGGAYWDRHIAAAFRHQPAELATHRHNLPGALIADRQDLPSELQEKAAAQAFCAGIALAHRHGAELAAWRSSWAWISTA